MKAVILAGGLGTRLSEETHLKPKPMLEIGGRPILWHILKIYSTHGINDFVICAGYKGYIIKEYFANYWLHTSDVTFDMQSNNIEIHDRRSEPWRVTVVDTGELTNTGGRLKLVRKFLGEETFCLTYGDGVGDVDIRASVEAHRRGARLATLTAVRPPGRFGSLDLEGGRVAKFVEKPLGDGGRINGGFFVLEPAVIDRVEGPEDSLERDVLEDLAAEGQLSAFEHNGFWRPMDTLRDKRELEALWASGKAPWKVWGDESLQRVGSGADLITRP